MNLTLWKPEAQRAERRMGTMRKYPGCSPIARPSRSNVFFSQSSMKVARHRLILVLGSTTNPCKTPSTGSLQGPLTVGNPNHTCLSHGMSLTRTLTAADWRVATGGARLAGPALSLSGGATGTTGLTLGRPGMPTPRYVCPAPLT